MLALKKDSSPLRLVCSLADRFRRDSLLRNSTFILGTAVVTSGIGYIYWVVAAHTYSPYDIGLASAFLSIMILTSTITSVGMGYALVQILPRREAGYAWSITLNTSIVVGILTSLLSSFIVVAVLPFFSPQFAVARGSLPFILIFVMGVAVTTTTVLLDQTFVAERATSNMAVRNSVFAVLKLLLLVILVQVGALGILSSWVLAAIASAAFAGVVLIPRLKRDYRLSVRGMAQQVRPMLSLFAGHHLISLGGMLPNYLLPVFVAIRLSVTENAYFYIVWMVGSMLHLVSPSVAAALFSEGSHAEGDVMRNARNSLAIIGMLVGPMLLACLLGGHYILSFFGPGYSQHGLSSFTLLLISVVPDAITNIYVSVLRVQGRLYVATFLNLSMAAITLVLAWILLPVLGIAGAGWAWLIAQLAGTLIAGVDLLISRYRKPCLGKNSARGLSSQQFKVASDVPAHMIRGAIWLMETSRLPAIGQNYTGTQVAPFIDTLIVPNINLTAKRQVSREAGRSKLKPIRLQSHHPCPLPGTNPATQSQFCERIDGKSTMLKDEVM